MAAGPVARAKGKGKGKRSAPAPPSDADLLVEKEATILELRETVEILEEKVRKLEQLRRLKDTKIGTLTQRIAELEGRQY